MGFVAKLRDIRQNLSWKLGFGRGKAGRSYTCPWWVDRMVYSLAYMQGRGVEIPRFEDLEKPDEPEEAASEGAGQNQQVE